MEKFQNYWRQLAAISCFALVAACATQDRQQARYESPPPASSHPSMYQVDFETNSYDISPTGERTIANVANRVNGNNAAMVTVVGRTDTMGSSNYNTDLSERRANAVRDALIATGKIAPNHVETSWTGQDKQAVGTYDGIAEAQNRVVDLYIH
jgi:OOP family OmpA-OmpF porin